jgi:hypothetical protein
MGLKGPFLAPHTHTRAKGRAPGWGFEFTTKAATPQGGSAEFVS